MDLIFFDLDGTLLNAESKISQFTQETLSLLNKNNIAFSVATGRTMLSAQSIIAQHAFELPQVFNNGVTVWDPRQEQLSLHNVLSNDEILIVLDSAVTHHITPFVNAMKGREHYIFHSNTLHEVECKLVSEFFSRTDAKLMPLEALSGEFEVTNISMIGLAAPIKSIWQQLNKHEGLIAYSGAAHEGKDYRWIDVHHRFANKGSAVEQIKAQLDAKNVIVFGDGDNDLSMFEIADERYAPQNAIEEVKAQANDVIGHHHEDGVAHFLRQRFSL
ncbi:HAD family hydrolase [Ningiella sp. W23]|uniref:HAD family hydrolase n=1 Tax=Ningiella sp. W23 TaxID=3023715 RepID=UPI0037582D5E